MRIREHLTYANVTSSLCLLLVVGGGTAVAAQINLPKNSVNSSAIAPKAVGESEMKSDAVSEQKLQDRSVGTKKLQKEAVQEQNLGSQSVSDRALADLAVALKNLKPGSVDGSKVADGSLTGADMQKGSIPVSALQSGSCAAGAVEFLGGCWDMASSTAGTWQQAAQGCAGRGGSLPSIADLLVFTDAKNVNADHEWVDDLSYDSSLGLVRTFKVTRGYLVQNAAIDEIHAYRCVLPLLHS
jgi:hypothetical protein